MQPSQTPARRKPRPPFDAVPPWERPSGDIHRLWALGVGAAVLLAGTAASLVGMVEIAPTSRTGGLWLLVCCLACLVAAFGLVYALLMVHWRSDPRDRFVRWLTWLEEREAAAGRVAEPKALGADHRDQAAVRTRRLAERLARLKRFEQLDAPKTIIEEEQRMIREAIADLPPTQALSVMRSWPELARRFDPKRRSKVPADN